MTTLQSILAVVEAPTSNSRSAAAYGGDGWQGRERNHVEELGVHWADCGIDSEWRRLEAVLLHQPGDELQVPESERDAALLLDEIDVAKAADEHAELAETYRSLGVEVIDVEPAGTPSTNQMFCADLFVMTPQGAILARPAGDSGEKVVDDVPVVIPLAASQPTASA